MALIGLKLAPFCHLAIAFANGSTEKASRRSGVISTIFFATPNTMRACEPVVAAVITCAPGSSSQHRQYSRIPAASVDFAFFRAIASSAVLNLLVPSDFLNPKRLTTKKTCEACRTMVDVAHLPSMCGSCSMNSQALLACRASNLKPSLRSRSARKRFAARRNHFPNRWRRRSATAARAYSTAIAT